MANNNPELDDLVADIREQIQFMYELGVREIASELPRLPVTIDRISKAPPPTFPPSADPDNRVRASEMGDLMSQIRDTSKPEPKSRQAERSLRDLLGATKISNMTKTQDPRAVSESVGNTPSQDTGAPSTKVPADEKTPTRALRNGLETLEDIRAEIGTDCTRCELCEERTQVVNSVGSPTADLMIVGEAPGADEDLKGEPFVGRAGKLLTKILEAIDFSREEVFIGNINRCRPPANRQPTLEESAMCKPFLLREIEVLEPKVIVVLGNTATKNLLDTKVGITKLRGTFVEKFGVKVMPTFHPAYLLRDPRKKREVWEDMKKVREYLNSVSE